MASLETAAALVAAAATTPAVRNLTRAELRVRQQAREAASAAAAAAAGGEDDGSDEEPVGLNMLGIDDSESEGESDDGVSECDVAGLGQFLLTCAPDDGSADATLFAYTVWSGSKLMARWFVEHPELVRGKRTVELGAASALPSLVALALGSGTSVITDYPEPKVIAAINDNVDLNRELCSSGGDLEGGRVAVVGHLWGSSVGPVTAALVPGGARGEAGAVVVEREAGEAGEVGDAGEAGEVGEVARGEAVAGDAHDVAAAAATPAAHFDVAFLSECLWMHREHEALARSVDALLGPGGAAYLTFAHHIPGMEDADDAFFALCEERYGFATEELCVESMDYMWDARKSVAVYLRKITRVQTRDADGEEGA